MASEEIGTLIDQLSFWSQIVCDYCHFAGVSTDNDDDIIGLLDVYCPL